MSQALSSVFRPKCHLQYVQATSACLSPTQAVKPLISTLSMKVTRSAAKCLTRSSVSVCNNIDTDGAATPRRSQGGGPACSRCFPSPSAERGRPSLHRRARLLRSSRPRAGQVRNGASPPGRRASGQPGGRSVRLQPTSILCRRSGFPGARHPRTVAASARSSAQSQVQRGSSRLRRAVARRTGCSWARNRGGGGQTPLWSYSSSPVSRPSFGSAQKKTRDHPPVELTTNRTDGRYLFEQYEALRREALRQDWKERGHGMALFVTRGMTAWVAAVAALEPAAPEPSPCVGADTSQSRRPMVALSFRAELTAVLAGMVLAYCGGKEEAVG